jgi:hypothetical protein
MIGQRDAHGRPLFSTPDGNSGRLGTELRDRRKDSAIGGKCVSRSTAGKRLGDHGNGCRRTAGRCVLDHARVHKFAFVVRACSNRKRTAASIRQRRWQSEYPISVRRRVQLSLSLVPPDCPDSHAAAKHRLRHGSNVPSSWTGRRLLRNSGPSFKTRAESTCSWDRLPESRNRIPANAPRCDVPPLSVAVRFRVFRAL